MEAIVIVIGFVVLTYFLAKPKSKGPKRKSKKFGKGLFCDKADNFARYDSYF